MIIVFLKNYLKLAFIFPAFFALFSCASYRYTEPEFSGLSLGNSVKMGKVHNFRYLGGIKNSEGKTLRDSIFFRSGNLSKLKKSNWRKLDALKISKIIDLRTKDEAAKKPDIIPNHIKYINIPAFEDREDELTQARKLVLSGEIRKDAAEKRMLDFYTDYPVENPAAIRKIIHEILDSPAPVLYHCTAGKDRTGIISMLILKILNFSDDAVMQEYLLSNNQRKNVIEKRLNLAKRLHFVYPQMDIEVLEKLSWIERNYLNAAISSIEKKYGSVDNYIAEALAISPSQREFYIQKFTK